MSADRASECEGAHHCIACVQTIGGKCHEVHRLLMASEPSHGFLGLGRVPVQVKETYEAVGTRRPESQGLVLLIRSVAIAEAGLVVGVAEAAYHRNNVKSSLPDTIISLRKIPKF